MQQKKKLLEILYLMNQIRKLKTDYNAKIKDIEDKTPNVTNLVPTAALTTVENKIPKVSKLVKKTDYNEKIKRS